MLFTDVIHAIHPHLMKDAGVPDFMRNLIEMLCDISEDDWYTKRDPSSTESYKDGSLRKFYTSGPTKKLARKMLARLTKDVFLESIYSENRSDIVLDELAKDISPFISDVTSDNVGEKLFDLLVEALNECIDPTLANTRKMQEATKISSKLKNLYGSGLLDDCNNTCSIPGCSQHLQTLSANGQSAANYEIIIINEKKAANISNICAVCHNCFQEYILAHSAKERKKLESIKTIQIRNREARETLSEIDIDKGISSIVESLINIQSNELNPLNYDPVPIENKIDEQKNLLLSETVKSYVTKYFFHINQTMQNMARQKKYSDELIRAQIKAISNQLEEKGLSQIEIFENLTKQIHRISKRPEIYCQIIICYFIQSCEVFHDITQ